MTFGKNACVLSGAIIIMGLASCSGVDRSDEQPLAPVVETLGVQVTGDSCTMQGLVVESHNSALRECGFVFGTGDTLHLKQEAAVADMAFTVVADSLIPGEYYYAAYARNGISTSYGDTLYFTVVEK